MEAWTATFTKTKTVSSAKESLKELIEGIATRGDDYEKVSIKVQALSEEKRATFCDEVINYFARDVPSFGKMTPNVEFHFDEPHPPGPSSSSLVMARQKNEEKNKLLSSKHFQFDMWNQSSGEGFTLSICTNSQQSEVHTMGIQANGIIYSLKPPKTGSNSSSDSGKNSTTTGVWEDLYAAGLLGPALLQHLPWCKRVQVEGVCRRWQREALTQGWADVRSLGSNEIYQFGRRLELDDDGEGGGEEAQRVGAPTLWQGLIARVGPHLTSLDLKAQEELGVDVLRAVMSKCRKLRHFGVGWLQLISPGFLELLLCAAGANAPKSLHLHAFENWPTAKEMQGVALFFQTLNSNSLPMLEDLQISVWGFRIGPLAPALRFPPNCQLGNLRRLVFDHSNEVFNAQSLSQLPSLCPALRSFTLHQPESWDISFLGHFSQLEHLKIVLCEENLPSFDAALLHLGGTLKALEVWARLNHSGHTLTPTIASCLPKLEHLGLRVDVILLENNMEVEKVFDSLASLAALRSLDISSIPNIGWDWLLGICHRLEYLKLGSTPPLATIYRILRKGKSLRSLRLGYRWNAASLKALADAASATAFEEDEREEALGSVALPILNIEFDKDGDSRPPPRGHLFSNHGAHHE